MQLGNKKWRKATNTERDQHEKSGVTLSLRQAA